MKIKTSAIPEWFFSSSMFNLETNISSSNYNSPKQRIYDYSTFPTYTAPSNKIAGHPEYDYTFMKNQRNSSSRIDPGEQVGYNIFPRLIGLLPQDSASFLNAYSSSQQIRFATEGGLVFDNNLNLSSTPERIQWINGEISNGHGIGYTIEPQYYQNVRNMLTQVKSNPISSGSKYGIYSLQAFPNVWNNFGYINGSDLTPVNTLCNYLINPPTSVMEETGFDFLCEDLYSVEENEATWYGAMGIYMKQLARRKYELDPSKEIYKKFYYILWSHSEFFLNKIPYKKNNSNNLISNGEINGLQKVPSAIHLNYSLALAGVTLADGFWHFIDRFCTFGPVDIINENGTVAESNVDLEQYSINGTINNIDNTYNDGGKTTYLRGQYYKILPAMTWLGVNQYAALAIWHAYLQRDIIQDTTYNWFTPDFRNMNGVLRTGNEKRIPYNLHYNEPTVEAKYSADKTECLLYVCNFKPSSSNAITPYIVKVILNPTDTLNGEIEVPVVLKSSKAELVRVTF
jgi:hypothetical protein